MSQTQSPDPRLHELQNWLSEVLNTDNFSIEVASADASFRRYFRIRLQTQSYIAMDAPPDKEDCQTFIKIAELLTSNQVNAPIIFKKNLEQGFLLISDFGDTQYLSALNKTNADELYKNAINSLLDIQQTSHTSLPAYDCNLLQTEMNLFSDWFLEKHLQIQLDKPQQHRLHSVHKLLIDSALQQPVVFVHRDYHSRNLMLTPENNPGIIDFQDAVAGPLTYDMASLLKDCYISWPDKNISQWLEYYTQQAVQNQVIEKNIDMKTIRKWFDLMATQRHLKAIGIFSRLNHRDNKPGYLHDIPRTLNYVVETSQRYSELKPLAELIDQLNLVDRISREHIR